MLWWTIATALILLPTLPLPRWTGASDEGPLWAPHVEAWVLGLLVVALIGLVAGRLAVRLVPSAFGWPEVNGPALVGVLAVLLTVFSAYTMRSVFASNPHIVDEMAQLFHARVFAAGRLAGPPPEPAEAFLITHAWVTDAGWVSQFPPGQTVLLTIGLLLDAEWLVNPLLGGLGVILVYFAARGLYGPKTAKVAAFLWAGSAWVLVMSGTYLNHVGATTLALASWALLWGPRRPRAIHVVAAGLALGAATATRPLDGLAAALPILAWLALKRQWPRVPWLLAGGLPVAVAWGYVNWRIYGHPLTLGYTVLWGPEHGMGFHTDPWGQPFNPLVALSNAAVAIRRLYIYLYEWPIPPLLPLVLWALLARHRHPSDVIVGLGLVAAPLLYFFYWHSGFYLGPRFYYAAAPMLVIGTARAWRWGWTLAKRARPSAVRWDAALAATAGIVILWGGVGILPIRIAVLRRSFVTVKLHPEKQLEELGVTQALVLVPESWGARVGVGLWGLGILPGVVERAYRRLDTCDLHHFVREARAAQLASSEATRRLEQLVLSAPSAPPKVEGWPDPTIRLRPRPLLPPDCRSGLLRDLEGFTLYGHLVWRNAIGLDSGIVFARDMHERNAALLARYPGWEVWRFAPPAERPNGPPVLARIRPPGARAATSVSGNR